MEKDWRLNLQSLFFWTIGMCNVIFDILLLKQSLIKSKEFMSLLDILDQVTFRHAHLYFTRIWSIGTK